MQSAQLTTMLQVLLFAAAATASPLLPRQETTGAALVMQVTLANSGADVAEDFRVAMDGTAIATVSRTGVANYDSVTVRCAPGLICIPEYSCALYDENLVQMMVVNPGTTDLPSLTVGQVTCSQGLI